MESKETRSTTTANIGASISGAGILRNPAQSLQVTKAVNGWVINLYSSTYVAKSWNEMTRKLADLFQVEQSEPSNDEDY